MKPPKPPAGWAGWAGAPKPNPVVVVVAPGGAVLKLKPGRAGPKPPVVAGAGVVPKLNPV